MWNGEKILYDFEPDLAITTHRVVRGPARGESGIKLECITSLGLRQASAPWILAISLLLFLAGAVSGIPGLAPATPLPAWIGPSNICLFGGAVFAIVWAVRRHPVLRVFTAHGEVRMPLRPGADGSRCLKAIQTARSLRVLYLLRSGRIAEAANAVHSAQARH